MNYEMLGSNPWAMPSEALSLNATINVIPLPKELQGIVKYLQGYTNPPIDLTVIGKYMKSGLDRAWVSGNPGIVNDLKLNILNVKTLLKDSYWKILDSESDLREYVRYLALWPAFGINLNGVPYGIEEDSIYGGNRAGGIVGVPKPMILSNPLVLLPSNSDREQYIKRINNFYDVVLWKFLKEAQQSRGLLSTYDEDTILSASLMAENVLSKVPEFLNTMPEIRIFIGGMMALTIQTWGIPSFPKEFTLKNIAGLKTFTFGNLEQPIGLTTIFNKKTYGLRQALEAQYNHSSLVFLAAKEILLAHLAALKDPTAELRKSPYADDPQFNLFLIWSGLKDEKGKTVYTDVAVNQAPGNVQRQAQNILVPYGPTSKNFEAVPLMKQYLARGTTGQSMADIDRTQTQNKSNMGTLLLVAGGIAAAAIASKYA